MSAVDWVMVLHYAIIVLLVADMLITARSGGNTAPLLALLQELLAELRSAGKSGTNSTSDSPKK